ncbi:hypothetical protein BH11ARM1_BH11ARM1_13340 [soil metagenome]
MARSGDQRDIDAVIRVLKFGKPTERKEVIQTLLDLPSYLKDWIDSVRSKGTGEGFNPKEVEKLERIMGSLIPYSKLGDMLERTIIESNSPDPKARKALIIDLINRYGEKDTPAPYGPSEIYRRLGPKFRMPGTVVDLINNDQLIVGQLLGSPNFKYNQFLLWILDGPTEPELVKAIEVLMDSPNAETRHCAFGTALSNLSQELTECLVRKASIDRYANNRLIVAYGGMASYDLSVLKKLASDPSPEVRQAAKESIKGMFPRETGA